MIRPLLCLAAEGVIRDAVTDSISVFNIMEGIAPEGFPVLLHHISFFVLWERQADDPARIRGTFSARAGEKELHSQHVDIDFQDKLRNRTTMVFGGLILQQAGPLTFSLVLDDGMTASFTIQVNPVMTAVQSS